VDSNDPTSKQLAEVPAMDLEKRAEQLAAREWQQNTGNLSVNVTESAAYWMALDGSTKDNFRENARRELAEEAKRRGDHDEMRRLHDLGQVATTPNVLALEWMAATFGLLKLIDSVCSADERARPGLSSMSEVELDQTEEYLRQAADRVKRSMLG
jgi:hypothetical protein